MSEQRISTLIKTASQLFIRLANKRLRQYDIPHAYTPFLLLLSEEDGQTQAALHRKIGIEQPTAVRTLDRMERDGFIQRRHCQQDRRATNIFLTTKAKRLLQHVLICADEINEIATTGLSKSEAKILSELLQKLIQNIEKELI